MESGTRVQAKGGRVAVKKEFSGRFDWRGQVYTSMGLELIVVPEDPEIVITVIARYK